MRGSALVAAAVFVLGACAAPPAGPHRPPHTVTSGAYDESPSEIQRERLRLHRLAEARGREYQERVERVGRRLLETMPDPPKVQFLIDMGNPTVNAGATFGQVIVTSGLLDFVRSDDELAVVLGHELAHISEGHVTKGMIGGLAVNILAIVIETQAPGLGQTAGGLGQLALNRYTQGQEREADRVGIERIYRAGYDPRAAGDVQERLAVAVPQTMSAGYFDTHPSSVERMVAGRKQADQLLAQGPPPGREEVMAMERRALERQRDRGLSPPAPDEPGAAYRASEREETPVPRASRTGDPRDQRRPVAASEECQRAETYVRRAEDADDPAERERLYRRALRYCPGLVAARKGLESLERR